MMNNNNNRDEGDDSRRDRRRPRGQAMPTSSSSSTQSPPLAWSPFTHTNMNTSNNNNSINVLQQDDDDEHDEENNAAAAQHDSFDSITAAHRPALDQSLEHHQHQNNNDDNDSDDDEEYSPLPSAVLGGKKAKESPMPMVYTTTSHHHASTTATAATPLGLHHRHVVDHGAAEARMTMHSPSATTTTTTSATAAATSPLRQRRLVTDRISPYRPQGGGVMLPSLQHTRPRKGHKPKHGLLYFLLGSKSRRNALLSAIVLLYFYVLWNMHQQASRTSTIRSRSPLDDSMHSPMEFILKSLQQSSRNMLHHWNKASSEEDDLLSSSSSPYEQARKASRDRVEARRLERATRTRPPKVLFESFPKSQPQQAVVPRVDASPIPIKDNGDKSHVLASVQDLCGPHAKTAFASHSEFFGLRDALRRNQTSNRRGKKHKHDNEIRVVLTGNALSHPMGMLLALQLQQSCGVQVTAMVDPMQPSTRMHRLQAYAQRLLLLQNRIPQLQVMESFVGWQGDLSVLDKTSEQWKRQHQGHALPTWPRLMRSTGDVNLVAMWNPTHIVHFSPPPQSASYSASSSEEDDEERDEQHQLSNAFQIQSTLVSLEQVLASVAATMPQAKRPQVVFATTSPPTPDQRSLPNHLAAMQLVMAKSYHARYQVQSVHVQLPNGLLGPHSTLDQLFSSHSYSTSSTDATHATIDVVYGRDVAQAMIAAMQFRSAQPTTFAIGSTSSSSSSVDNTSTTTPADETTVLWTEPQLKQLQSTLMVSSNITRSLRTRRRAATATAKRNDEEAYTRSSRYLGWFPQTSVEETLLRTHAWSLDHKRQEEQNQWMIPSLDQQAHKHQTGDELLVQHALDTCAADDWTCHASPQFMPCASECSFRDQCAPSGLDGDLVSIAQESSEGCDIVLYTQHWGSDVKDIKLVSEYMEDGNPLICNYAFVSRDSELVKAVIAKVPDTELERFGIEKSGGESKAIVHERKLDKLNGRLLYRGWVLLWTTSKRPMSPADSPLLKMSPGRFFAEEVKFALFIEPTFPVTPTTKDIIFLVKQMHRAPLPQRAVKTKKPQNKYKLPSEPERRAIILFPQLRIKDSKKGKSRDMPSEVSSKLSIRQAAKYMRFEQSLGRESSGMKRQREFYDALLKYINGPSRDFFHPPDEPVYRITFADYWVRTRWVLHDLKLPESRQLRCEWYQEHLQWASSTDSALDQLSFAAVMAKREFQRRTILQEPDDSALHKVSSLIDTKKALTDAFEWHPAYFPSTGNRQDFDTSSLYTLGRLPYHSFDILPPDDNIHNTTGLRPALYVHIMSDRVMSGSHKAWRR